MLSLALTASLMVNALTSTSINIKILKLYRSNNCFYLDLALYKSYEVRKVKFIKMYQNINTMNLKCLVYFDKDRATSWISDAAGEIFAKNFRQRGYRLVR
jgi:hypothetical protein